MGSPFGVELPENLGASEGASSGGESRAADTAPEGASNAATESPVAATKPEGQEPQVTDLDSLDRFRFQGKELSKADLQKLFAGESRQQPESDNARFDQNFRYDLAAVLEKPQLLAEFRRLYPPEYVQLAERALKAQGTQPTQATSEANANAKPADPRFEEVYQVAQEWKAMQREQRIEGIKNAVDKSFDKFSKKYSDADPEVINSRLIAMRQQGLELQTKQGKLREDVIEDLFKRDHEARLKAKEDWWKQKVEAQKRANSQARDVGHGGSASSPPPQKARTIKEATANALASLESR